MYDIHVHTNHMYFPVVRDSQFTVVLSVRASYRGSPMCTLRTHIHIHTYVIAASVGVVGLWFSITWKIPLINCMIMK